MRTADRARIERRLLAAEDIVARRAMTRVLDMIRAELDQLSLEVMRAVDRAGRSRAAPRDAVGVLLREIATVDAALAERYGRAVGIEVPVPSTAPRG